MVVGASVTMRPTTPYPLLSQGGDSFSWLLAARRQMVMREGLLLSAFCFLTFPSPYFFLAFSCDNLESISK